MKLSVFILLFSTLVLSNISFGQSNAIKGIVAPIIPFAGYASISYERQFNQHNALSIGVSEVVSMDEMGLVTWYSSALLEYRYIFISKKAFINNTWAGIYTTYIYQSHTHSEGTKCIQRYYLGGISFGKRLFINPSKRLFFDMGLACSFGVRHHAYGPSSEIMPRAIINFGFLF